MEISLYKLSKSNSGEIRSLELQIKALREKKTFLPKQIEILQHELQNLPSQLSAMERQLNALKNS